MEKQNKVQKHMVATFSLVLGILSIFLWEFSIFPIPALILGVIGITKAEEEDGKGFSIAGVVLGAVFLLVRLSH